MSRIPVETFEDVVRVSTENLSNYCKGKGYQVDIQVVNPLTINFNVSIKRMLSRKKEVTLEFSTPTFDSETLKAELEIKIIAGSNSRDLTDELTKKIRDLVVFGNSQTH